jgi:hypothetical protein
MVLLRPTNRLQAVLAAHGYTLNHFDLSMNSRDKRERIRDCSSRRAVVEADHRISENTPSDADAFGSIRDCLMNGKSRNCFFLERVTGGQSDSAPKVPTDTLDRVDILWVSPTEFVTVKGFLALEGAYELIVSLKSVVVSQLTLYSYSIFQFNDNGEVMVGPPPVMPPRFLSHVLAPILNQVASIELCICCGTPAVDSALSLIPTTGHDLTQDIKICFSPPQTGLLPALVAFPFHPKVCLSFWVVRCNAAEATQMHDCLRDLKHLQHLEIPSCLLDFECTGVPFTTNPAFKSLTLPTRKKEDQMTISMKTRMRSLTVLLVAGVSSGRQQCSMGLSTIRI